MYKRQGDITSDPCGRTDGDTTAWLHDEATGLELKKTYADGSCVSKTYDTLNLSLIHISAIAANAVKRLPGHVIHVQAALEHAVFQQAPYRVVANGGNDNAAHPEADVYKRQA